MLLPELPWRREGGAGADDAARVAVEVVSEGVAAGAISENGCSNR